MYWFYHVVPYYATFWGGENHLLSQRCMFFLCFSLGLFLVAKSTDPSVSWGKNLSQRRFCFFKKTSKLKFGRFQIGRYDTI